MNTLQLICPDPCGKVVAMVHHARRWSDLQPTSTGAGTVETYMDPESGHITYTIRCRCGGNYPKRQEWFVKVWQIVTRYSRARNFKWRLNEDPARGVYRNY